MRAEVAMALGRIGPDAAAAVPDLVPLLGDKSERIRREATQALGRIGTAAIAPLIAASAHKEVVIRARAVESLGYLPSPSGEVHSAVIKCAHDAVPEVRAAALKSLARFDLPDATVLRRSSRENVRHEEESVRLAVVNWLLGRRALLRQLAPDLESLLTAKHGRRRATRRVPARQDRPGSRPPAPRGPPPGG